MHAADREAAFRTLYRDAYRPLLAYALRRHRDRAEADDIVAETFAVAWRRLEDLPPSAALPWLYGVAANVARNQNRSAQRRQRLVQRLGSDATASAPEPAAVAGLELREALATLSAEDQEVLRLAAWEGLSHTEIGVALDCTANAVAIRLHRARGRLAAALDAAAARPGPPRKMHHVGGHSSVSALTKATH
jgi:RNA polymerase sigma-70 factor (ECF subfamily)